MLLRRLILYFIGVLLGVVLVYLLLIKDRERNLLEWLPGNRVLSELQENPLSFNPFSSCMMECHSIQKEAISTLLEEGSVDFSASHPREEPPLYYVVGEDKTGRKLHVMFQLHEEKTIVESIHPETEKECNCPNNSSTDGL